MQELLFLLIEDKVQVNIWDGGIGLPDSVSKQGHFGLGIMNERAKSLNAKIQLNSKNSQGTQIIFEFSH